MNALNNIWAFIKDNIAIIAPIISIIASLLAIRKYLINKNKGKVEKEDVETRDEFFGFLPGGLGKKCIGRKSEKRVVKNNIKNEESLFIYGSAGIGKSNLVKHSILEIKKSIKKRYKRVLYYNFAVNPDKDSAIKDLCRQIDPNSNDFRNLVNQNKYLIWLDGCEFTDCLKELMKISYNPVYILCSRDREQTKDFKMMEGDEKSIIKMNVLSDKNAMKLLNNRLFNWLPIHDVNKRIKQLIIRFVGNHPYIIYMIRQDSLYKRSPSGFFEYLQKHGLNCSENDGHSIFYKEEYNMEMLLKKSFGLDLFEENEVLSDQTKKALGFIGCLSEERIPVAPFFDDVHFKPIAIFKSDTIRDIKNSSINHFFIITDQYIQVSHSFVHKVLAENVDKLLGNDYSCLIEFLRIINNYSTVSGLNQSNYISNLSDVFIFSIRHHIYHCLEYIILNDIKLSIDDNYQISYNLSILASTGAYKEVLFLTNEFQKRNNELDDESKGELEWARLIAYDGLQRYEECISSFKEKLSRNNSFLNQLIYHHNILDILIRTNRFTEAKMELKQVKEFIKNNLDKQDDKTELKDILLGINSVERRILWYLKEENIDQFIENQEKHCKMLLAQYDKDNDFMVIEADMLLAFAYLNKDEIKARDIISSILSRVITRKADTYSINIIESLGDFFYNEKNYEQANEFFKLGLFLSENHHGSEHIYTNKMRNKYLDNKEKFASEKDNSNKLLILVSLPNQKWHMR